MGVRTRIGLSALLSSRMGSVELPEEITLCCPQCGTLCCDKGQCILEFTAIPSSEIEKFEVRLVVDCRNCGCFGRVPVVRLEDLF